MKTLTKIEYSNDTETKGQHTAYVTCANDEAMYSLTQFIESKTSIESLGCGGEEEGRIYETFSTTWAMNKKEFLQELRATIKEWKNLNR